VTLDKLPENLRDTAVKIMEYVADGREGMADRLTERLSRADRRKVDAVVESYFPGRLPCPGDGCWVCRSWR
jgi:hypothetical protein